MNIKNTNIEIKQGAYFIDFCGSSNGCGQRTTILTYKPKETIKNYTRAGFFIFGSPMLFLENRFHLLSKTLRHRTKNKQNIVVLNAMYHIQSSADKGTLKTA